MKLLASFVLLSIAITFTSCKKDKMNPSTMQAVVDAVLTDGIDGNLVVCDVLLHAEKYSSTNYIIMNVVSSDGKGFTIKVPNDRIGNFNFDNTNMPSEFEAVYWKDRNDPYSGCPASTGTMNITSNNGHRVTGTFNFFAINSNNNQIKVTEGSFDVEYDIVP